MMKSAMIIGLVAMATSSAFADPGSNSNNGGKQYELEDGTTFTNAGAMFQHLRDRDDGYAAGNPKDIVEAYPDQFDSVGDLIHQKRVD